MPELQRAREPVRGGLRRLWHGPGHAALGRGPRAGNRVGSWFSALGNGPSLRGPWVWLIVFLLFFGGPLFAVLFFWL